MQDYGFFYSQLERIFYLFNLLRLIILLYGSDALLLPLNPMPLKKLYVVTYSCNGTHRICAMSGSKQFYKKILKVDKYK